MACENDERYSHLDSINSLVVKCVHVLCHPRHTMPDNLSPLYDTNRMNDSNCKVSLKSPSRHIEAFYEQFKTGPNDSGQNSLLDIQSRQSIVDYLVRERILVSADLIVNLLADGGVYRFDLWQLCSINEFSSDEIERIIKQMVRCAHVFQCLSIGGSTWIYNARIISGALHNLFSQPNSLSSLVSLKLQQLPFQLASILSSCPLLLKLEIAQPSITDDDVRLFSDYLSLHALPVCGTLNSLMLPSSVKEEGLALLLGHFANVSSVRCTPFEQMLDLLQEKANHERCGKALETLARMKSISIAHPMSGDTVDRLLSVCPHVRELCLEVQEGMHLDRLLQARAPSLRRLALHNSATMPIKFVEQVVPVLESVGHQLEHLSLEYFDHIDLISIARLCPELKSLKLQWFSTITFQTRFHRLLSIEKAFSHLQSLRLRPRPHQTLSPEVCLFLLKNALRLRHIELYCCTELTDDTIELINRINPLRHLQTFILRHGHCVTNAALYKLVSAASLANNLVFHDCGLVPPINKEEM